MRMNIFTRFAAVASATLEPHFCWLKIALEMSQRCALGTFSLLLVDTPGFVNAGVQLKLKQV